MRTFCLQMAAAIVTIASPNILTAQKTFAVNLDLSFFDVCDGSPTVAINLENVTEGGTNTFTLKCASAIEAHEKARRMIADPQTPEHKLALLTDWPDADNWRVTVAKGWLSLQGITLPSGAYKLTGRFNELSQPEPTKLPEQSFYVYKSSGPSVQQFVIHKPSVLGALRTKLLGRESLYIYLITVLATLLAAALKKRAEKLLDRVLDYLGSFGWGRLAERRFMNRYGDYLFTTHRYLRLLGFSAAGVSRPQLEQVFISLRVSPFDRNRDAHLRNGERGVSFENATVQYRRLVVLGGPGAGKTTTLSYIILRMLQGTAAELLGTSARLLPVFVPLRRLSSRDTSLLDDLLSAETQILPGDLLREAPPGFFERRLKDGKCVLLLDGLDEVTDEATHGLAAQKINRMVTDYPNNRFMVTCRIAGWRGLLDDFRILEADDFNPTEVHRFIFGWHRAVISQESQNQIDLRYQDPEERAAARQREKTEVQSSIDSYSRRLINAVESSGRLMAVATNPMLLSLICLVHYVKAVLPRERPVLYEKCIELLIDAWDRTRDIKSATTINAYHKEAVLRAIAVDFQLSGKGEAPRSKVEQIIAAEVAKLGLQIEPQALLEQIEQRSGILVQRSIDVFGFSHLTLQEYLVARHLQLNPAALQNLWNNLDNQEWREVALLYAGLIDDATELITRIVAPETEPRWLLAGYSLGEARRCEPWLTHSILDRLTKDFEESALVSDTLLNVLASLCSDYASDPATPEQALSAQMIEHVERRSKCARAAIQILGKARIPKAIPPIVSLLGSGGELGQEVVKSLVLFGNIALTPMMQSFQISTESSTSTVTAFGIILQSRHERRTTSKVPLAQIIRVLQQLDTPESAFVLIRCFEQWQGTQDHIAISLALASMLENQHIASDLLSIPDSELPAAIGRSFNLETIIWPFHDGEGTPFDRLILKVRDDLAANLSTALNTPTGAIDLSGFKLTFSAIALFLATHKPKLSREQWTTLGFNASSDVDLSVLSHLHTDIRSGQTGVREGIRRALRGSAIKGLSEPARTLNGICEFLLAFANFVNVTAAVAVAMEIYRSYMRPDSVVFSAILTAVPFLWVACIGYASYTASTKWSLAIVSPVGQFLRRTPYLTPMGPWKNFAVVQTIWVTISYPTAALIRQMSTIQVSSGHADFDNATFAVSWNILWILLCWYFYKFQVLRVDAPALLLLKHPLGRKALGLPPQTDTPKLSSAFTPVASSVPEVVSAGGS